MTRLTEKKRKLLTELVREAVGDDTAYVSIFISIKGQSQSFTAIEDDMLNRDYWEDDDGKLYEGWKDETDEQNG